MLDLVSRHLFDVDLEWVDELDLRRAPFVLWADTAFMIAIEGVEFQSVIGTTTLLLSRGNLGWKPNSLEALWGEHVPISERCVIDVLVADGNWYPLKP